MVDYLKDFNLSSEALKQFGMYYSFLLEENEKINLTAIIKEDEVYIKHFYDSLIVTKYTDFSEDIKVADIGSGAGFPGIPLKIMYPNIVMYLIEPTKKRCNFLRELVSKLNLKEVYIIDERAEKIPFREVFDLVLARAVAPMNVLLELCIPFIKVKGKFIALKGSNVEEEIANSANALKQLSAYIKETVKYSLPQEMGQRALVIFSKDHSTNKKYPRNYSLIKKKGL